MVHAQTKIIHLISANHLADKVCLEIFQTVSSLAQIQKQQQNYDTEIWILSDNDGVEKKYQVDMRVENIRIEHFTVLDDWLSLNTTLKIALESCGAGTIFHFHQPQALYSYGWLAWHCRQKNRCVVASFYQPIFYSTQYMWQILAHKCHVISEDIYQQLPQAVLLPYVQATTYSQVKNTPLYKPVTPVFLVPICEINWLKKTLLASFQHYLQQGGQGALWLYETSENMLCLRQLKKFLYRYHLEKNVHIWPQITPELLANLVHEVDAVIIPKLLPNTQPLLNQLANIEKTCFVPANTWIGKNLGHCRHVICIDDGAWLQTFAKSTLQLQTLHHIDSQQITAQTFFKTLQDMSIYSDGLEKILYHAAK